MERTVIRKEKRASGSTLLSWDNLVENNPYLNNSSDSPTSNDTNTGNSSGIWDSIFSNAGGWISSISGGIASIVQAKTGNYPTYQQDNTPKVLAIAGIGAVVLIIILVIIFKK